MNIKILIIVSVLILGLVFCLTKRIKTEGFNKKDCPNLLVQKGKELHLLHKDKALIPGANPIKFENLEEYKEYVKWQRHRGIRCPVLYLQQTYDTQNNENYRLMPDPIEKQAGLPSNITRQPLYDANKDNKPFNENSFAGVDIHTQNNGVLTPLDEIFNFSSDDNPNAMDTDWCGIDCARKQVKTGAFGGGANRFKEQSLRYNEIHDNADDKRRAEETLMLYTNRQSEKSRTRGGESVNPR